MQATHCESQSECNQNHGLNMFGFKTPGLHLAQATSIRNPQVPVVKARLEESVLLSLRFQHNVRVFEGRQDPHLIDRILTQLPNLGFHELST